MIGDRAATQTDIAQLTGGAPEEVSRLFSELESNGVFSVTAETLESNDNSDGNPTLFKNRKGTLLGGVIFDRKMVASETRLRQARESGKKGGRPTETLKTNGKTYKGTLSDTLMENEKGTLSGRVSSRAPARLRELDIDSDSALGKKDSEVGVSVLHVRAREERDFDEFWKIYPRREDKGHSRKAFAKALKLASAETITAGAGRYAERRKGEDQKYTALAATWLNGERWTDEAIALPDRDGFGAVGFA